MNELATTDRDNAQLSVTQVMVRMDSIRELMKAAMVPGIDYGKIPGTGSKPTLLKPGAEKLCVMFQLDAEFSTQKHFDGVHMTVETTCTIYHAPTGSRLGSSSAICSTREAKYAYRKAERKCPECGKEAIIWSKNKSCYMCVGNERGGCWAKFSKGDERIEGQEQGRVANQDIPDSYNTVLRIAEKRALVAAVRQVTGASSFFDEERPEAESDPDTETTEKTVTETKTETKTGKTTADELTAESVANCKELCERIDASKSHDDLKEIAKSTGKKHLEPRERGIVSSKIQDRKGFHYREQIDQWCRDNGDAELGTKLAMIMTDIGIDCPISELTNAQLEQLLAELPKHSKAA